MLLRPTEAAALAGLSTERSTARSSRGDLRASRLRIGREDFDDWVARNAVRVETPPTVGTRLGRATRGSFRRLLGDDEGEGGVVSVERGCRGRRPEP